MVPIALYAALSSAYIYVNFDNHMLCISYSALTAALLLFTYVCTYVPVVTWLPAHWPCICTHIVQHVSEGASNDAVDDFKGICRSYAKQCGSACRHT